MAWQRVVFVVFVGECQLFFTDLHVSPGFHKLFRHIIVQNTLLILNSHCVTYKNKRLLFILKLFVQLLFKQSEPEPGLQFFRPTHSEYGISVSFLTAIHIRFSE